MATTFKSRNKWINQQIQKRQNKIQYASKHYGSDKYDDIIFKRKNPLKQRKARKKFRTQRSRKKIFKRMAFDYDDFVHQNKNENYRRIQTRPTIQQYYKYQYHDNMDIESMYYDYYQSPYDPDDLYTNTNNKKETRIDRVGVTIQFYHAKLIHSHKSKEKEVENKSINSSSRWNWRQDLPRDHRQENDDLIRAVAASLNDQYLSYNYGQNVVENKLPKKPKQKQKHFKMKSLNLATTSVKVYGKNVNHYPSYIGHENANLWISKIANNAWNVYKHNYRIKNRSMFDKNKTLSRLCHQCDRWNKETIKCDKDHPLILSWKCSERYDNGSIEINGIFDIYIPELFPLYHIIFQFMGYNSFKVEKANAIMKLLPIKKPQSNGVNGYKGYNHNAKYQKRRKYMNYIKDVTSYIPTYFYYKTKDDQQLSFHEIGEYNSLDWKKLAYYSHKKKKHPKKKTKKVLGGKYKYVKADANLSKQFNPAYPRCPCGCGRKIKGRGKKGEWSRLWTLKSCIDTRAGNGYHRWRHRWRGYKRHIKKRGANGWWSFRSKTMCYLRSKYGIYWVYL